MFHEMRPTRISEKYQLVLLVGIQIQSSLCCFYLWILGKK
jgi:hypothetical protein